MNLFRIVAVALMAIFLVGCTMSEKQFVELREAIREHPEVRPKYMAICTKEAKRTPRAEAELIAEVLDAPVASLDRTICKRLYDAFASGRLTYADYRDLTRKKPTPRLMRILRGRS